MTTTYAKSKYKDPWKGNGVPQPNRASQGWGAGWPHCQASKMVSVIAQDQTPGENYDIKVTVRKEIGPLIATLLEATDKSYDIDQHDTGAYNCRPIAGTSKASNHSWGLAIDLNWEDNPQGKWTHSVIPPAVVAMWIDCGFGWGGFYKSLPDLMHFEYLGKPSDVAADLKKAKAYLNKDAVSSPLTQKVVLQLAVDAGFSRADANVMSVIAYYESGWDPKNIGDATLSKYGSRGLWQIFTGAHTPKEVGVGTVTAWSAALATSLEDPKANAHAAHVVFKEQGFKAWSTYNNRSSHSGWAGLLSKAEAIDLGTAPVPAPKPTPAPAPKPVVYNDPLNPAVAPGGHNAQVADLQRYLVLAGYGPIPSTPPYTQFYGGDTEAAVARFHAAHPQYASRAHDVAIGPKGWAALEKLAAAAKNK